MVDNLNCEPNYEVIYYDRFGRAYDSPKNISSIDWNRRLDNISTSKIEYVISEDSCCEQLGIIEPIAHQMGIFRNKTLSWWGWVSNARYGRSSVTIEAFDALGWLKRRIIHNDLTWVSTDLTDIFIELWHDAMDPSPVAAETVAYPSGVLQSREEYISANRITWNAVQEMLDTGLDLTVFGQKILVGIIPSNRPMEIKLSDISGDVDVTKYGNGYANKIYADANDYTVGIYPPGPPVGNSLYPLSEFVIKDGSIQDQVSADDAARSRYEYSRFVPRLVSTRDSIVLNPNFNIHVNDMIPGMKVVMDTTGLCYATKQELRLGELNVHVESGIERLSISLQPLGPEGGLDGAEDPVA